MTTKQICQLGFQCPYHSYGEDGDEICIYPYIRITEREDNELFGFPEESDCPLLEWESPLDDWRIGYEESERMTEKSEKVNKGQIDFFKLCPSCGSPLMIKTYIPAGKVYVCNGCGWKMKKYEYDEEVKE